jgi:hypothetical protein
MISNPNLGIYRKNQLNNINKGADPTQDSAYTLGKSPLIEISNLAEELSWSKKIQIESHFFRNTNTVIVEIFV